MQLPLPPEEPLPPQEGQPLAQPQLNPPLLPDDIRRSFLYNRYILQHIGGDGNLQRMVSIIDCQFILERYMEAALVDDGYSRHSIIANLREIRGILSSPRGRLLSERTLNLFVLYLTQIREHGTRQSLPYRRICEAVQRYDLLLRRER